MTGWIRHLDDRKRDPFVIAAALVILALAISWVLPGFSEESRDRFARHGAPLLSVSLAMLACWRRAWVDRSSNFWLLISFGLTTWTTILVSYFIGPLGEFLDQTGWNILYFTFYFFLALAIESQADIPIEKRANERWSAGGLLVSAAIPFVYFVLLPSNPGDPWFGPISFFLLMDAWVMFRAASLSRWTKGDWKTIYSIFAMVGALFLTSDLIELAESWVAVPHFGPLDIIFVLPLGLVTLAARIPTRSEQALTRRRWIRSKDVFTLTLSFLALHLILGGLGWHLEASRQARDLVALIWVLLLGGFAYVERFAALRRELTLKEEREQEKKASEVLGAWLDQTTEAYRSMFENAPLGIYRATSDGRIIETNPALLELLGYETFEEFSEHRLEVPESADVDGMQTLIASMKPSEKRYGLEARWLCADGSFVHLRENVALIDAGEASVLLGLVEDLSLLRKAQEDRETARRFLGRIVDHLRDALIVDDNDGKLVWANRAFLDLFGFEPTVIGQVHLSDYVAEEDRARLIEQHDRRVRSEDVPTLFECRARRADGTAFWAEVSTQLVIEGGEILGTQSLIRDVTARKETTEQLRVSNQTLRHLIDSIPLAVVNLDSEARVVEWNPAAERIFGWTREEIIGQPYPLIDGETGPRHDALHKIVQDQGNRIDEVEIRRKRRDGATIDLAVWANPIVDADGKSTAQLGILADITERKRTAKEISRRDAYLEALFRDSPSAIARLDGENRLVDANQSFFELFGWTTEDARGQLIDELIVPDEHRAQGRDICQRTTSGEVVWTEGIRKHKDGREIEVEVLGYPCFADGDYIGTFAVYRDISARKKAEQDLIVSKERYQLAARAANDGLWDWDLTTGALYFSPRCREILGAAEAEITSVDDWASYLTPKSQRELHASLERLRTSITDRLEIELDVRRSDGYRTALCRGLATKTSGRPERIAGSLSDITPQRHAEQQLRHDAGHDGLTGLPNRPYFIRKLTKAIDTLVPSTVLFVDLNRFKIVNDSLGHMVGDEILKEVGVRLVVSMGPRDFLARLGGDEFTIITPSAHFDEGRTLAEAILVALDEPFVTGHQSFHISATIGIASTTDDQIDSALDVLRNADIAMYEARRRGVPHLVFDHAMHKTIVSRVQLENDLRSAVDENQFRLVYQPIVDSEAARTVGYEALLRWSRPDGRFVSPAEFVPILEESGLIVPLTRWILAEAARQSCKFPAGTTVSVNLSAVQFARGGVAKDIREVLEEVPEARLAVEITEGVMLERPEETTDVLSSLRELGLLVYVDDFGTGYSSLAYLSRLPLDRLKIDRSFIMAMESSERDESIVRAIIALSQDLGLDVVAEGVETREQWNFLKMRGCKYLQGYYFSKPLPGPEIAALPAVLDPDKGLDQ